MERAIQSLKDRVECFDDSFPCSKKGCSLQHVRRWLNLYKPARKPKNNTKHQRGDKNGLKLTGPCSREKKLITIKERHTRQ
jgi:hypothetical protein